MEAKDFINSIDAKVFNKIRNSNGNAECRRALKEHLIKQTSTTFIECGDCGARYNSKFMSKCICQQ
jgi:hypothetical protein